MEIADLFRLDLLSKEDIERAQQTPLTKRFELGDEISAAQRHFLAVHGFIIFSGVAKPDELDMIVSEADRIEQQWLSEKREAVHGVPLVFGKDPEGKPYIQRFPFTSVFSEKIKSFVRDDRFEPIRKMFGDAARIGDSEKDGLVFNRYLNVKGGRRPRLGWHTDGLRDLFYCRMPGPMLNVGMHFDRITAADGGLRLIPGSHHQGFFAMCFRKAYFVSHKEDPQEIVVETFPGDLTIHDGRLWHRVAQSQKQGWASLRRSMFVPYLTGPFEPKDENSPTPFYHKLNRLMGVG